MLVTFFAIDNLAEGSGASSQAKQLKPWLFCDGTLYREMKMRNIIIFCMLVLL